MTFIERETGESLAMHLHRNADVLGADRRQASILREAAAMSLPQRSAGDRALAGRMAEQVRNELKASMDAVIFAAQARGERVERYNDAGAGIIRGRDGLLTVEGNEALFNTGLHYRLLFEKVGHADIGSQLGGLDGQPGAIRSDMNGLHAGRLHKVYAAHQLATAERAVAALGLEALSVLRSVAGEGHPLNARGMSGHARRRRDALLRSALEVARLSFAETGGLRIRGT